MKTSTVTILVYATISILAPICFGLTLLKEEYSVPSKYNLGLNETGKSMLSCEDNGRVTGLWKLDHFFQSLSSECKGIPKADADAKTTSDFYTCIMETVGMTENDGTPDLHRIDIVKKRILSKQILNNLPHFNEDLDVCALDYVTNYNQIDKAQETGAETFFKCIVDALKKCGEEFAGGDINNILCRFDSEEDGDSSFVS